jgi:hypothetical protein
MCPILNGDHLYDLVFRVPGYRSWGPRFDSQRYQIFWEVVGLERGPLSLVETTEELLDWESSGCGSRRPWLRPWGSNALTSDTLCPQKVALTSPKSGCRSVGIVRLRAKTMEFSFSFSKVEPFTVQFYNIVHKKEILRTVSNTSIYCSSDKVGTNYIV